MKNLSFVFNIVLAIAVAILYYLHFKSPAGTVTQQGENGTAAISVANPSLTVYVNGDSLLENYEYFKKAKSDFEAKSKRSENDLVTRRTALEKEFAAYQQNGATMSNDQRQRTEEALMRKEQEFRAYSENLSMKLQKEQEEFNEGLFDKVASYLKEHSKEKNYKIVHNYTKGTGILYANDSLDITKEVLKGLNEEFKKKK